ncbi:MAG: DUF1194 domain-containing protein [Hyphomicrobiales bacterium]
MKFCQGRILLALLLSLLACVRPAAAETADLALVLAIDASGSVDEIEYGLQLKGIAAGFRDAAVRQAIRAGTEGRIAVNLIAWAEHGVPKTETGWHMIEDDASAERFAGIVETFVRDQNGATGLGEGVAAAVRSITGSGIAATRRVIDVSGDGRETPAREYVVLLPQARAMALAFGIVLNGLAIANAEPDLADYYRGSLQAGPGSFVIEARTYADFAEAMRRKLIREIQYRPEMSSAQPAGHRG